ncbi:hypothetical protein HC776_00925 [bacterium]|nr:hypothetical protein [bacterium]
MTMRRRPFIPVYILLLAAALYMGALTSYDRFHPDEAFFMTFARNAAVQGDGWLRGSLDKPPLTLYLQAASLTLFALTSDANGVLQLDVYRGEFAARMTGVWMTLLWVAALMRMAWALYRDQHVARFMGLVAAGSPLVIAFAPTAFMDTPMLLFATLALWAAIEGRPGWSGTAFILAFASKPQAVYLAPLIVVMLVMQTGRIASLPLMFGRWLMPVVLGAALLGAWDVGRGETSVFVLGAANNLPEGAFWVERALWQDRFWAWVTLSQYLVGDASFVMLGVISFFLIMSLAGQAPESRWKRWDVLMLLWLVTYSAFHIITRQNVYDRYMLFLVIPLGLVGARSLSYLRRWNSEGRLLPVFGAVALLVALSAYQAATGAVPIGGDRGAYSDIDTLANYLNEWPVATVIYDRWLGWELGYYLGPWSNKRRVYYPTPAALAEGAARLPECGSRLLVAPLDQDVMPWLDALRERHFQVALTRQISRFRVYEVVPACAR